jgi:type IV pilus assembly protein PilA
MKNRTRFRFSGFTLIEILVVIGMLAILSTVVLVAVNPLRQFAQARNSQRQSNVETLLNAISERIADNGGTFLAASTSAPTAGTATCEVQLPATATDMRKNGLDIRPCLVSSYLAELPFDPTLGINTCSTATCDTAGEGYDLGYTVAEDPATNRVTVCAPGAVEAAIPGSAKFCLTR